MTSTNRRGLLAGVAALCLGSAATGQGFELAAEGFEAGRRARVVVRGAPGLEFCLMFDTATGDWTLPGGAGLGLGFSEDFAILYRGQLSDSGSLELPFQLRDTLPAGPSFHLQAAGSRPGEAAWVATPRLDLAVGEARSGSIVGVIPPPGSALDVDACFELRVDRGLSDVSVGRDSIRLRREDTGEELPLRLRLVEASGAAVVVVEPRVPLPREQPLCLELSDEIRDDGGNPLRGPRRFHYRVPRRDHPILLNSVAEVERFKDRIQRRQRPWSESYDRMRADVEATALAHRPRPRNGAPPDEREAYVDVYARWYTSARCAQDLALAYLVSGETRYADRAVEILRAWLVFEPRAVGKASWALQTDLAGICMLDALDLLWSYEGLRPDDRAAFRDFLFQLARAVRRWQLDPAGEGDDVVRAWSNALLASLGVFLEEPALVDFAIEPGQGNPAPFLTQFERLMDAEGRLRVARSASEADELQASLMLLQAWSLTSRVVTHQGRDLYHHQDADGLRQVDGWLAFCRALERPPQGWTEARRLEALATLYPIQRVDDRPEFARLLRADEEQPLVERRLRKKAATFSQKVAGSRGSAGPASCGDVVPVTLGCTSVQLAWSAPPAADESGLAVAYELRRDGALIARLGRPSYQDRGLQAGCSYQYEVRAVDASGRLGPASHRRLQTLSLNPTRDPR